MGVIKKRGITYAGGGVYVYGNGSNVYSLDETVVGAWIDDKPIYQKTFVLRENSVDKYTYSSNVFQNVLPANIDWINITTAYLTRQSSGYVDVMNSTAITIVPDIQTRGIFISTGGTNVPTIIITVQYTKTTD